MKLFRKTFAVIAIMGMSYMFAQDIAGDYRLNGTNVRYTSLYRGATPGALYITDSYGLGVTLPALTFQPMSPMNQFINGPYPKNALNAIGVNLNMSMYSDGTGHIYEGSMYPTAVFDEETCTSVAGVLPASDFLQYTSDLDAENVVQSVSILGEPTLSPYVGATLGGFSLQAADIFDYMPAVPTYMDMTGSPAASAEEIAFPGPAAGYITKDHNVPFLPELNGGEPLNPLDLLAGGVQVTGFQAPGDLYLEWHAVDGGISQSGFGDDLEDDEDGDGTPFDRILGIPAVPASYIATDADGNGLCGGGAFDPFDFRNLDPAMPIIGGNSSLEGIVTSGGVDLCYESGGLEVLAGGVCMQAILADLDASGAPDMNEGCDYYELVEGYPSDVAATAVVEATCNALGLFSEAQCVLVSANSALAAVEAGLEWGCDAVDALSTPDADLGGLAPICLGLTDLATGCYADLDEDGLPDADGAMECAAGEVCGCDVGFGNCETFGDRYGTNWTADCLDGETSASQFYALNPAFADYGNFVTANGVSMQGCLMEGVDAATCFGLYGADDSDHDFNGVDGILVMDYTPQCFPELQVREVHTDFQELDAGECFDGPGSGSGDVDNSCADGGFGGVVDNCLNVADVVLMVQAILGTELEFQETCRGDIDGNGIINVVDVVQTVQSILNGLTIDASSTEIIKTTDAVHYTSNGTVGAFQFIITHDEDFSIELTEKALVAEYSTHENKTTVVIVMPESEQLFTVYGQYEISEVLAANSEGLIESSVITPEDFTLSNAYPNPFNPTTSLLLNLDQDGIVAVKVFNLNGQLIDVLTDGTLESGMHTITWDAQEFASGVYFIKAYIGSEVITQKVSLMK